ncbi:MAG: TRAP transporter small permease [Agrococcus sp.]
MHVIRNGIDAVLKVVSIVLFAALVMVVVWQVASRNLLAAPATWTEEAARYLFVWVAMVAAALVFGERGHIAVDLLIRKLPGRAARWMAVGIEGVVIFFAATALLWGGIRSVAGAWNQGLVALPFTVGQMYTIMPIVGALVIVYSLFTIVDVLRGRAPAFVDHEDAEAI